MLCFISQSLTTSTCIHYPYQWLCHRDKWLCHRDTTYIMGSGCTQGVWRGGEAVVTFHKVRSQWAGLRCGWTGPASRTRDRPKELHPVCGRWPGRFLAGTTSRTCQSSSKGVNTDNSVLRNCGKMTEISRCWSFTNTMFLKQQKNCCKQPYFLAEIVFVDSAKQKQAQAFSRKTA